MKINQGFTSYELIEKVKDKGYTQHFIVFHGRKDNDPKKVKLNTFSANKHDLIYENNYTLGVARDVWKNLINGKWTRGKTIGLDVGENSK